MMMLRARQLGCALVLPLATAALSADDAAPLAGTGRLEIEGDIAARLVDGVDRFLLRELARSADRRAAHWQRDLTSIAAYEASVAPNRARLAHILGVRDARIDYDELEYVATTGQPALVGHGDGYRISAVRWPAFGDVEGEGLLLEPTHDCWANVVAIPDADVTPEMLVGLAPGVAPVSRFPLRLVRAGCRVLVPALVDRGVTHRKLSNREFLYRSAFELGRHIIGYEIQKVLAGVDWFAKRHGGQKVGVIGHGEGALLALYAAALDHRVHAVCVSSFFDAREDVWRQPIYRNVFGLLEQFGDAEVASLVAPRALIVEAARAPEVVVPPGTGGGPGRLTTPDLATVRTEIERARALVDGLPDAAPIELVASGDDGRGPYGSAPALEAFLAGLSDKARLRDSSAIEAELTPQNARPGYDAKERQARMNHALDRHNQWLLRESAYVRKQYFSKVDTSSLAKFEATIEPYRLFFRDEVIGRVGYERLDPRPRSRRIFDAAKCVGYEVVLDVFPDVIAFGILIVPKSIAAGDKRPVVVCQHGLEGRPRDVADPRVNHRAYGQYAVRLAERGFVTFAPQNLYIFQDRFRTLQRKANPVKKTLFSIIVPQHQQIVDWLGALPFVDARRIAFYGLSYGGKTAMRVPPLVDGYCLSICSADFNEWVWKNASTRTRYSYVWTGEYEIFEFDLGSTFNYAEMAALIAPRPFMVERGHFDGVSSDEAVAYEFAKVRHLYQAKLGIGDRCEIEFFVGPHAINGVGTFEFLERHLRGR